MKPLLASSLLLLLTACGEHSILTVRNNVEIPQVPESIVAKCPTEVPKVTPAIPGRYSEEESAEIVKRYRFAYVTCRDVVGEIKDFYADQKIRAEKFNTPR
jgi:hypothetical protein